MLLDIIRGFALWYDKDSEFAGYRAAIDDEDGPGKVLPDCDAGRTGDGDCDVYCCVGLVGGGGLGLSVVAGEGVGVGGFGYYG